MSSPGAWQPQIRRALADGIGNGLRKRGIYASNTFCHNRKIINIAF